MKGVFEKLSFREGSVWTGVTAGETKLRFQIPPVECGRATLHGDVAQLATGATNYSYFMYVIRKSDTYYIFTYFASLCNSFIPV